MLACACIKIKVITLNATQFLSRSANYEWRQSGSCYLTRKPKPKPQSEFNPQPSTQTSIQTQTQIVIATGFVAMIAAVIASTASDLSFRYPVRCTNPLPGQSAGLPDRTIAADSKNP